jgi:colicin import membrane protein
MKISNGLIISIAAHLLLIVLVALNINFSNPEVRKTGPIKKINATAVNKKNVDELVKKIKKKDSDKKKKEVERLRKLKQQEEDIRKKRIEEENKVKQAKKRQADAERKRKVEEKKAADAKKKRITDEKARKKKVEEDRKKKLEADKKAKADAERKRKLKLAEEKKKREEEAKKKRIAEEKAAQEALEREMDMQMEADQAELDAAIRQQVLSEIERYNYIIQSKIKRNWIEPESKGECVFQIRLAPGGLIIGIAVISGDSLHCESGRRAINKSEPLPVPSDPKVFAEFKVRTFRLENKDENKENDDN